MIRVVVTLAMALALWALPAWSATYYVDYTCGNGTAYNPATRACTGGTATVRTIIQDGVNLLAAGDILFIRAGTYNHSFGNTVPNGSNATTRTVISAYPISRPCSGYNLSWRAWGDCAKAAVYEDVQIAGSSARIRLEGAKSWIVFEGLQFPGPGSGQRIQIACSGNAATNPPTCTGGTLACSNDLVFAGLKVGNTSSSSLIGHAHLRAWVLGSEIYECGTDSLDHCMYWSGIDSVVYGNVLRNSRGTCSQYYRQVSAPSCLPEGDNMLIEGNVYHDCTLCGTVLSGYNNDAIYQNNLVYNASCGVSLNSKRHKVYNNTFVGTSGPGIKTAGAAGDDNIFINNVVNNSISLADGSTGNVDENNYIICSTCASPAFRDPINHDYRPLPTDTLLVGQGQNLFAQGVTIDADGNARPASGAFAIGAYEVANTAPTPFNFSLTHNVIEEEEPQILQGNTADIVITVTRLAGTAAAVTLSASGLPPNTTASFAPASCTPSAGSCTSTLTLDTAASTPNQSYTIMVTGTSGAAARQTSFDVDVICQ